MKNYTALCARCKVPLGVTDSKTEVFLACPICREGDTVDNVTREVGEYIAEKMTADMFKKAAAEQSIALTFTEGPKRIYRFINDDKSQ